MKNYIRDYLLSVRRNYESKKIIQMNKKLEAQITRLENLIFEGKRDQEILKNFLGDGYYDKYQDIKNKIKDPEYKDIYKLIKKDPDDVKNYIDSFQSRTDVKNQKKSEGAELIYKDSTWKVYRITTYSAAQLYGSGTKWCITGRYDGHEERGEYYFNHYINENDLDGGYYFYIKNDNKTKYCLLRKEDGTIHSMWNAADNTVEIEVISDIEEDFPSIEGIFTVPNPENFRLFSSDVAIVQQAIKDGKDISERCADKTVKYYDYTPLQWQMQHGNKDVINLFKKNLNKFKPSNDKSVLINSIIRDDIKSLDYNDISKQLSDDEVKEYFQKFGEDWMNSLVKQYIKFFGRRDGNCSKPEILSMFKAILDAGIDVTKFDYFDEYSKRTDIFRALPKYGDIFDKQESELAKLIKHKLHKSESKERIQMDKKLEARITRLENFFLKMKV